MDDLPYGQAPYALAIVVSTGTVSARAYRRYSMSRGSWRSAEALQKRRAESRNNLRAAERARLRRERETDEWHITGEPAFQPKNRSYWRGGGVDVTACKDFMGWAERAIHLHDRGRTLTREMSAALASLERRNMTLADACLKFEDTHSPHLSPDRREYGKWEVGAKELRLFVEAAGRMTSAQRHAFTLVLAPHKDKSNGYIGPVEPLAVSLQRASKASIEQAVSGALFPSASPSSPGGCGRFARGVRAAVRRTSKHHDE